MKKTTGGRNGYGAKLANIFSTKFTIETADSKSGKKYRQTFRKNMTVRCVAAHYAFVPQRAVSMHVTIIVVGLVFCCSEEPVVTPLGPKESSYTCVTFEPDFERFKMEG